MTNENANKVADGQGNEDENKKTQESGAQDGGEDGGNELEELKKQIEEIKSATAGKDAKISALQKEIAQHKTKEFQSKNETEQLAEYKKLVERFEKRDKYREAFKEVGIDPEEFTTILQTETEEEQAKMFKSILEREKKKSADEALEAFKKKELEKKPPVPKNTNGKTQNKNVDVNNAIRSAAKK
ncbi:MAG: hypothetical protein LBK53_09330 [Heliobacteriaceae bacterium]|jgi:hypothetical protein|nr:hypothetical protein [Heliobacteriaceae bacterium]